MLHLHGLAWAKGNLAFTSLRDRVLQDSDFRARTICYLEAIATQGVDESIPHDPEVNLPSMPPSAEGFESDEDFHLRLSHDSNCVARRMQAHSRNHLATCFKYRQTGSKKNASRFNMPRDLVPTSTIDEFGLIHLARNHAWINPWNPAIASCVRSNQDISWIPTISKTLSLIYYITNYATKDDVSPWQIVAKAALLKQSIEKAKVAEPPSVTDRRLRENGVNNFAIRCFNALCFNALSQDREINQSRRTLKNETGDTAPVSILDNYKWRGPYLAPLALFGYCMLVKTKNIRDVIADDMDFDLNYPRYATHVQRQARTTSQVATVIFNGQLTVFQTAEDAVPGGHPKTTAVKNDMAEVLLGLFVPWHRLTNLFRRHATKRDTCIQVWAAVTNPPAKLTYT
ncbi:hypothetical protein ETB97_008829 [Aspergillus alliaceus]|uniref:Uncharacterized protein n=1 Tax=Petromyces alliaceus TaxID=209559 RepID=A0A8H5ZSR7_PETAA|nr:hypothetical protein ETB97_008829 [Aspergillus burnettii]